MQAEETSSGSRHVSTDVICVDDPKPSDDTNCDTATHASGTEDTTSDTPCSICLGPLENKSFTDSCFHMFCFACLLEWSRVKAVCPLCKQPFISIIHSVRSLEDYDRHYIQNGDQSQESGEEGARFRYRTTLTADRWLRHLHREHDRQLQLLQRSAEETENEEGIAARTRVYELGQRALRVSSARVRDVSPAFLAAHPACVHRLAPWLRRELAALLHPSPADRCRFVLELVLELVTHFDIDSEDFMQHVRPFIGRCTSHFVYEFRAFASAPYDMRGYDRRVRYPSDDDTAPRTVISDDDADESSDGSDVMVVNPPVAVTATEVVTVSASPLLPVSPTPSSPLPVFTIDSPVRVKTEVYTPPGSDVEITGYEKPWDERSPDYQCVSSPTPEYFQQEKRRVKRKAAALAALKSSQRASSESDSDDSRGHHRRRHHRRRRSDDEDSELLRQRRRRERSRREEQQSRPQSTLSSRHRGRHEDHRAPRRGDRDEASRHRDEASRHRDERLDRHHGEDMSAASLARSQHEERTAALLRRVEREETTERRYIDVDDAGPSRRVIEYGHRRLRDDDVERRRRRPEPRQTETAGDASVNPWSLGSLLASKTDTKRTDDRHRRDGEDKHYKKNSDGHKHSRR